jgi:hypothetical protein
MRQVTPGLDPSWKSTDRFCCAANLQSGEDTDSKAHIVALHARRLIEACSNQYHVVALDISGYGKSPCRSSSFRFPHDERR